MFLQKLYSANAMNASCEVLILFLNVINLYLHFKMLLLCLWHYVRKTQTNLMRHWTFQHHKHLCTVDIFHFRKDHFECLFLRFRVWLWNFLPDFVFPPSYGPLQDPVTLLFFKKDPPYSIPNDSLWEKL